MLAYLQVKKLKSKKIDAKVPEYVVAEISICGVKRQVFLSDTMYQNLLNLAPREFSMLPVGFESKQFPIDITLD